ncbi:unnamed protein product [Symbiodinium natans]|uniref:DRBM domain-containing protein n=1 Tax=Symbiodinium natans TaxID=878477 RepID=A0A812GUM2_9DINO|nr:unnamed protein product [Symbiodinium natans]
MVRRRRLSGCLGSALLLMAPTTTFFAPSAAPVEPPEVLPKSHLAGALQRAMGRNEVYRSETLFFHRTDETQDRHFALLRIPALPTKKADGTNFIPTEPFEYFEGVGRSRKEAEDQAARQALSVIRKADSEITRWLSWSASTSKQALELASAQIAAPRATDGSSRQWMHRALRRFLRRRALRKSETPFYMRKDEYSGAYHVVLAVPWKVGAMLMVWACRVPNAILFGMVPCQETPSDPQRNAGSPAEIIPEERNQKVYIRG